jgi:hypothetical protein
VLCLDEMGPESAKSYPGVEPIRTAPDDGRPAGRARQQIAYARRGKGYVLGAFTAQERPSLYAGLPGPHHRKLGGLP